MFVIKYSKRLLVLGLLILIFIVSATALAAANTVPVTAMEDYRATITIYSIHPQCSGIVFNSKNLLIIGTAGNDTLYGGNGDNCILGLGGNDIIYAGHGNGTNIIDGGPGYNICYRGNGPVTFINCQEIH